MSDILLAYGFASVLLAASIAILILAWGAFEDTEIGSMVIERLKKRGKKNEDRSQIKKQ